MLEGRAADTTRDPDGVMAMSAPVVAGSMPDPADAVRTANRRMPAAGAGRRRHPDDAGRLDVQDFDVIPDVELLAHLLELVADGDDLDGKAGVLLDSFGGLAGVLTAPASRLRALFHLDSRGVLTLRLLWEVAARLARQRLVGTPLLASSDAVLAYCTVRLARERVDQVRLLFLDAESRLIAEERHQSGTVGDVTVYPREVLRRALDLDAVKMIVARGRVTGAATITRKDREYAKALDTGGSALGIHLVDYLVIGRSGHAHVRPADERGRGRTVMAKAAANGRCAD